MKIYAARHGHTNFNRWGILNSDPNTNVHLTKKGIAQAEELAEQMKDKRFDRIYSSELPRTIETAKILNRHHNLEIVTEPLFNDIRTGMDGWPVWLWLLRLRLSKDAASVRFGKGETLIEARDRVYLGVDKMLKNNYKTVLLVAHSHTLHRLQEKYEGKRGSAGNADLCVFDTETA